MNATVDILLATYNGQKYIEQQLDSIVEQSYSDWRLIVRDDGSTDKTLSIVRGFVTRYPKKVCLIEDNFQRLGPAKSFEQLCAHSDAPYIAFCDQDDVWLSGKLALEIEELTKLEASYTERCPLLIHSDLHVVDENMQSLSDSFWQYQHLNPDVMSSLERLLVQNYVTGCTVVINKKLLNMCLPFPENIVMHDWWLALVAMCRGKIINLSEPTVLYRQHANNDTGAKQWGLWFILKTMREGQDSQKRSLLRTRKQAEALMNANVLSDNNIKIVEKYISMYTGSWLLRRIKMIRMGFFKYGVLRNMSMFLRI